MTIYERLVVMAEEKQKTTEKFVLAFQEELKIKFESTRVALEQGTSEIHSGILSTYITVLLKGGDIFPHVIYKIPISIEAIEKKKVEVTIANNRGKTATMLVDFDTENGNKKSLAAAIDATAKLLIEDMNYKLEI